MNGIQRKRLLVIVSIGVGLSITIALTLYALSQNINVFYTPSQVKAQVLKPHQTCRIGGMVVKNSVIRKANLAIEFTVTDFKAEIKVKYQGILPDLFREGQGIVALGKLAPTGEFIATQVLAKHDEKYMPPEMAAMMSARPADEVGTK